MIEVLRLGIEALEQLFRDRGRTHSGLDSGTTRLALVHERMRRSASS